MVFGRFPSGVRMRELDLGCLEMSVRSGCSTPVGVGRFLIGVSIWQGGSSSSDTSNYRSPIEKRARPKAGTGTGMSGNIS